MSIVGYYEGDRSEFLAAYVLSQLGFCVPVPRQFDRFLVDTFVQVFRTEDNVHRTTSLSCGFQVKSTTDNISIKGEHLREVFYRTGTPFFVAVVDKKQQTFAVYTTIQRFLFAWTPGEVDVTLVFDSAWPLLTGSETAIPLGKPIVEISIPALDSPNAADSAAERRKLRLIVLWIMLERMAIAWRQDQMPFVPMPKAIHTNERFDWSDLDYHVIFHPEIVERAALSLGKTLKFYKEHLVEVLAHDTVAELTPETKQQLASLGQDLVVLGKYIQDEFK